MFQWLRQRPATKRRPARPAPIAYRPAAEELPPAFFADDDAAFLDLTEPAPSMTPAPTRLLDRREARIAEALAALPPFPEAGDPERNTKLMQILAELDQIASDVCEVLEPVDWVDCPLSVRSIPR